MTTSFARHYLLDTQFDEVSRGMELRQPQRDALEAVHRLFKALPCSLQEAPPARLAHDLRRVDSRWNFPGGIPEFTFALATGVGKTRLMGALMAYLVRTGQTRDFLLVAPRTAIIRKLEEECRESSRKYIFGNRGVMPEPHLCHRGNLAEFDPTRPELVGARGPNVFVFTTQLLSMGKSFARRSPYAAASIQEYLASRSDLVVLVDESHHLGDWDEPASGLRSWRSALAALKPRLMFSMTATPRGSSNVLSEYGLARCLHEGLYTKAARLIVDDQAARLSGAAYDAFTLRFARDRLEKKAASARARSRRKPGGRPVKPVMLVCAETTRHADEVAQWLRTEGGFRDEEVLVIHSKRKTDADLELLAGVEDPQNPVRAVVQVHALDEGWDVSNVYVIAPLRNVNSYVNGRQVMGRGLRLPWGERVGEAELDTLDVLAFGQQTIQDILEAARAEFGSDVRVERAGEDSSGGLARPVPDDNPGEEVVVSPVVRPALVRMPRVEMVPAEPRLDVRVRPDKVDAFRVGIELGRNGTEAVRADTRIPAADFVRIVVDELLRQFRPLSVPLHQAAVEGVVRDYLSAVGGGADFTDLDPVLASKRILDAFEVEYAKLSPSYLPLSEEGPQEVKPVSLRVPRGRRSVPQAGVEWDPARHRRIPFHGWMRSALESARFDSGPEFEMARRLDRMKGVTTWLRNDPPQFRFPTSRGLHEPDFIAWSKRGRASRVLLLEIKGEHLFGVDLAADAHARDLGLLVDALADAGNETFSSALVLGADVFQIESIEQFPLMDATRVKGRR